MRHNNSSGKTPKKQGSAKDYILYGIVILIIAAFVYFSFASADAKDIGDSILALVGDLVILLLGVVGVFEFCYDNDITFLVPNSFMKRKEARQLEQIEAALNEYLAQEEKAYHDLHLERTAFVLSQLGLSKEQFDRISLDIIKSRLRPTASSLDSLRKKLEDIVFSNNVIFDLENTPAYRPGLRYYFKFHDLMHDKLLADQICNIMAGAIYEQAKLNQVNLANVAAVVLPHSGNYLLGIGTARILGKPFIKIIPPDKIIGGHNWEGHFRHSFEKQHVIIVHDVLLTSKQVVESIELLPDNCIVDGVFCLIYRSGHRGREKLEELGCKTYSLLEYSEQDVTERLEARP